MTKEELKQYAKSFGADLVGIASMDRFEGVPAQMDPRYIMPEAKSMIVMGFRVMRGSLRGIEEGTQFFQYPIHHHQELLSRLDRSDTRMSVYSAA